MAEQPTGAPGPSPLHELAELVRRARHLDPEAQAALAGLVEELGEALDPARLSGTARAHLEEHTSHLLHALHAQDEGPLSSAKHRLEEAAVRLEAEAPQATGIVRRLIDALANLGI